MKRAMGALGWKEEKKPEKATIVWDVETLADTAYIPELQPHQLINRIPIMIHCCRKAVFARHLARLRALLPPDSSLSDGKYLPMQWALPLQSAELARYVDA